MAPKRAPVESLEFHTDPIWTWDDCSKRRHGDDLKELPSHWPAGVSIWPGPWASWLPDGWQQGLKQQPAGKKQVFISPEGRVFYFKGDVQKELGMKFDDDYVAPHWPDGLPRDWAVSHIGEQRNRKMICINPEGNAYFIGRKSFERYIANPDNPTLGSSIRLTAEALQKVHSSRFRTPQDASGCSKTASASSSTDTSAKNTAEGCIHSVDAKGSDSRQHKTRTAEDGASVIDGYRLDVSDDGVSWVVYPDDVESIMLDTFTPYFESAGWTLASADQDRHTFVGHVDLVLVRLEGKLLVQSNDKHVVKDIASHYVDWLASV